MNTNELFRIWDRFDSSDAAELVFETADSRVRLRRDTVLSGSGETEGRRFPGKTGPSMLQKKKEDALRPKADKGGREVKAPLVGTFYRAPGPGEKPFVQNGQKVKKGDTLGIIEAMKMMNEITSPCDGTVLSVLAEDETLVQFDQCLMVIREEQND